jgi:hydrogenase-4 component B
MPAEIVRAAVAPASGALWFVSAAAWALLVLIALAATARQRLLSGRCVEAGGTWDCGYAQPSPRMQYTAASFAQPLTELFGVFLRSRDHLVPPEGFFPQRAAFTSETPDVCTQGFYRPVFTGIGRGLSALRWLQHGEVHLYVLYIALTLLGLLLWQLG